MLNIIKNTIKYIIYIHFGIKISKSFINIKYFGKKNIDYCLYDANKLALYIQDNCKIKCTDKLLINILETKLMESNLKYKFNIYVNDYGLNFTYTNQYLSNKIKLMYLNYYPFDIENKKKIIVEFSSPNIVLGMTDDIIRSTLIGNSFCTLLEKMGNTVYRFNHIGDYGLAVGLTIQYIIDNIDTPIIDIKNIYDNAKIMATNDNIFLENARHVVYKLQNKDVHIMEIYNKIKTVAFENFNKIYKLFDINIENILESSYDHLINEMMDELWSKKLIGIRMPLINTLGCYTYNIIDLVALRHKLVILGADEIYYVADSKQNLHMNLIFEGARLAGWLTTQTVVHIKFGLNIEHNKIVKICSTLPGIFYNIHNLDINHIKYFMLRTKLNLNSKILMNTSNTNNYITYIKRVYTKLTQVLIKNNIKLDNHVSEFYISNIKEIKLSKYLCAFGAILQNYRTNYMPYKLCIYLYDLARCINSTCIKYVDNYNLILCTVTVNIMNTCFDILGIKY
jgi:arginyl-tRNA synthetase